MRFQLSKTGAHLAGGLALLVLTALALLPLGRVWLRMLGALVLAAGVWGYCRLYASYGHWGVQAGAVYSHTGLLFTNERRIPLGDITAVRIVQSPLERPLTLCVLTVCGAGSFISLPFVRREDAEALLLLWQAEQGETPD